MSKYLTPKDLQQRFGVSKSTAYEVFKKYREQGGEIINLGGQHVREELIIDFLRNSANERNS